MLQANLYNMHLLSCDRDPFFDAMTRDDDDDDDEEDGFFYDGFHGDRQDPFDSAWRFGFSFGPDGMRIQEPPAFGHVLQEMEEIFSQLGRWEGRPESGHIGINPNPWSGTLLLLLYAAESFLESASVPYFLGVPMLPPPHDRADRIPGGSSGNPLRDFMLKSPDDPQKSQAGPASEPRCDSQPSQESPRVPSSPFHGWTPFSKV